LKLKKDTLKSNKEKFSKAKLISSRKYNEKRDLLQVLLEGNKEYCFQDVESYINEFLKRKVN